METKRAQETEERLFQLVLTEKEVTVLGSLFGLGITTLTGDIKGAEIIKALLFESDIKWPEAIISLSEKMTTISEIIIDENNMGSG